MNSVQKTALCITSIVAILIAGSLIITNRGAKKSSTKTVRIALFEPAIHPAIEEIAQGFMDTMNQSQPHYEFRRFNANGNKILMRAQAEEIAHGNFDLIATIGVGCSVTMKELCAKQSCSTPIVFTAVDDPERLQLRGNLITGVTEQTDYHKQLTLLLVLKPSVKKILLVYDPAQGSGLEKDKQEITAILKDKGINVQAVQIHAITEIQQKVSAFMDDTDVVMILKDNTIVSGIDSLITLCQRYHKPLLASDLNSGIKGAVLAYGIREYDSGVYAAKKAQLILEQGKKPCEIPVSAVENVTMKVNRTQMAAQGLPLDDKIHIPNVVIEPEDIC